MTKQGKNAPALQTPNPRDVEIVINLARSAPRQNEAHAEAAKRATDAVIKFFEAVYAAATPTPAKSEAPAGKPNAIPAAGK